MKRILVLLLAVIFLLLLYFLQRPDWLTQEMVFRLILILEALLIASLVFMPITEYHIQQVPVHKKSEWLVVLGPQYKQLITVYLTDGQIVTGILSGNSESDDIITLQTGNDYDLMHIKRDFITRIETHSGPKIHAVSGDEGAAQPGF